VEIWFQGPYSWIEAADAPCLFGADVRTSPGLYLWTVPRADGHLVYYVGETGRAAGRVSYAEPGDCRPL